MLRRLETYALRDGAPIAAVQRLRDALRDCTRFIPEVLDSAIGTNRSGAPLDLVWEHAYASPAAYRRYMAHPFHAAVLDRYLLADSPERVVADSALGAGLAGYACAAPVYRLARGVRRILLLRLAPGAAPARRDAFAAEVARAPERSPELAVSVLAANTLAARWFDGESELPGRPAWTHLWEQGFASQAALDAYRGGDAPLAAAERCGFAGWQDVVERTLELAYEVEPGAGHPGAR